eukprot:704979-Rhodomonas_salina.1
MLSQYRTVHAAYARSVPDSAATVPHTASRTRYAHTTTCTATSQTIRAHVIGSSPPEATHT